MTSGEENQSEVICSHLNEVLELYQFNSSEWWHQFSLAFLPDPSMQTDLKWSLKDKIIHWNLDYQHCEFPRESDTLYQAPSYASSTSNHVHHGKNLQQYLNEDRVHQEYIKITKHFEYQEQSKEILSRKVYCPRRYYCEHCIQKMAKFT